MLLEHLVERKPLIYEEWCMCFEPGTCQYKKVIGLIDDSADVRGRSILIASPTDINSCNLLLNCKPKRPAALGPKASAIKPVETLFIYFMLGIGISYRQDFKLALYYYNVVVYVVK